MKSVKLTKSQRIEVALVRRSMSSHWKIVHAPETECGLIWSMVIHGYDWSLYQKSDIGALPPDDRVCPGCRIVWDIYLAKVAK